jgi:hypothetical protein
LQLWHVDKEAALSGVVNRCGTALLASSLHNLGYPAFTDGPQATGEVHRSHGGHYDVNQGGESFDDVIQVELEFLHRHAKKAD